MRSVPDQKAIHDAIDSRRMIELDRKFHTQLGALTPSSLLAALAKS